MTINKDLGVVEKIEWSNMYYKKGAICVRCHQEKEQKDGKRCKQGHFNCGKCSHESEFCKASGCKSEFIKNS